MNSWVQLNLATATSVELAGACYDLETNAWYGAAYQSRKLATGFYTTLFHKFSNAYFQYNNSTLDDEQWTSHLRDAIESTKHPYARRVWADWNHVYDDGFRALMQELIAETDSQ